MVNDVVVSFELVIGNQVYFVFINNFLLIEKVEVLLDYCVKIYFKGLSE